MNFKNIEELKAKLKEISEKRFIKSQRYHNSIIADRIINYIEETVREQETRGRI